MSAPAAIRTINEVEVPALGVWRLDPSHASFRERVSMQPDATTEARPNGSTVHGDRANLLGGRFTRGEWLLPRVAAVDFLHDFDHVLRADHAGGRSPSDVTPFAARSHRVGEEGV